MFWTGPNRNVLLGSASECLRSYYISGEDIELSSSCEELRKFLESLAPAAWEDSFADDGVDRGDGSLGHLHDALNKSAIFQVSTWSLVDGKHMFEAIIFFKPLKNSSANGTALILSPSTKTHDKRENKNVSIMNSKELRGLVNTAKFLPGFVLL